MFDWIPAVEVVESDSDSTWAEWDRLTAPGATDEVRVREEPTP